MQQGDQFIFVDRFNQKHKLTYTGTRREIKGCMYEFFTEEGKDGCCFFDDSEVATMKSVVDMTKLYVKLTAKPDTWFKAGTEVFDYDEYGKRITFESYHEWLKSKSILVRGIHIYENGVEVEDGELCSIDEFDVELTDSERDIPWPKPLEEPITTAEAEARQKKFEDGIMYIQG